MGAEDLAAHAEAGVGFLGEGFEPCGGEGVALSGLKISIRGWVFGVMWIQEMFDFMGAYDILVENATMSQTYFLVDI